ncbi:MAG: Rab family GTPase [Chloroflexota bacterium]
MEAERPRPPRTFKVTIAGDGNVGKTSLVRRYCTGMFQASRVLTIGVDFQTKMVDLGDERVKLTIWDVAGQDRFSVMRGSFYRGSSAVALVYDITVRESLDNLSKWVAEIRASLPQVPFIVVGNKIDLERMVDPAQAQTFAAAIGAPYTETSCLTGEGVEEMFRSLVLRALETTRV